MVSSKLKYLLYVVMFLSYNMIYSQHKTSIYLSEFGNNELKLKIEKNATDCLSALNIAFVDTTLPDLKNVQISITGEKTINALWTTAPFQCAETEIITNIIKDESDSGYEIRNIPFTIKVGKDSIAYEEGVLLFNSTGVIDNVLFGLESHQYKTLLRKGKDIKDFRRRQLILNFIENFRTAYNRKDLDLLSKIFSDNALIIVGHVVKEKPGKNNMMENNLEKKKVQLIRLSKKQYLDNLKSVFKHNEYIDVGFKDINIVQHRLYPNIYGAKMKQYWKSSTYSDVGYLFLMIDFKDENNPIIHVRAWQPEKETNPDSAISLGDFEIIQ